MSKKVIVYLMRHGQTILNRADRVQGWCDGVLTKNGIDVAVNVGYGLADIKFENAYSSDLRRAAKTAQIVIDENKSSSNLKLNQIEGLREVYFGKFEGGYQDDMFNEILKYLGVTNIKEAEEKYDFQKAYCDTTAALDETNEAEDYETACSRVMKALTQICEENKAEGGNILVVAHGGMIRLIVDYLDKTINLRELDNSSVSKLIYDNGKFTVESYNDNSYCEKGKEIRKNIRIK